MFDVFHLENKGIVFKALVCTARYKHRRDHYLSENNGLYRAVQTIEL